MCVYTDVKKTLAAKPWLSSAEVAHEVGTNINTMRATITRRGDTFTAIKRKAIIALANQQEKRK